MIMTYSSDQKYFNQEYRLEVALTSSGNNVMLMLRRYMCTYQEENSLYIDIVRFCGYHANWP